MSVAVSAAALLFACLCIGNGRRVQYSSRQNLEATDEERVGSLKAVALAQLLHAFAPEIGWQHAGTYHSAAPARRNPSSNSLKARIAPRAGVQRLQTPDLSDYCEQLFDPDQAGMFSTASLRAEPGKHGSDNRFLQVYTATKKSNAVILAVAGAYPGLRAEQLAAPTALPHAEPGKWNFHMLTGQAAPGGFVALVDDDCFLSQNHPNAVVVVCTQSSLGLKQSGGIDYEVLAVIDRSDLAVEVKEAYDSEEFYAFADPQGEVHIRWFSELPEGWRVLGRVLYVQDQERLDKNTVKQAGFAECRDDFEF
mmetsp:Transcript_118049/g.220611  ORF Transcript_118049/g.220611 Transcript_118049/m.220611 type:complete len:308 (-) Transcript_118049:12-935(-)